MWPYNPWSKYVARITEEGTHKDEQDSVHGEQVVHR